MELIKRYVYAVVKWLPAKKRADIGKELESSIYDALEAEFGKKDEYSDEEVTEILTDLGSPWKVATGYTRIGERLISPELLQIYFPLTLIISGAVTLGLIISFIVGIFVPDITFGRFILRFLGLIPNLLVAIATVVGFTTIVFALIDHFVPGYKINPRLENQKRQSAQQKTWKPADLPAVPTGKHKISLAGSIVAICFTIVFMVLFNMFPDKLGIYFTTELGSGWQFVPVLNDNAVNTYLPFWNTLWILTILLNIYMIIKLRWTLVLRIFDIAIAFLQIAVLGIMINGPELIDIQKLLNSSTYEFSKSLIPLAELMGNSIDIILIIGIIGTSLGIIGKIVNAFMAESQK